MVSGNRELVIFIRSQRCSIHRTKTQRPVWTIESRCSITRIRRDGGNAKVSTEVRTLIPWQVQVRERHGIEAGKSGRQAARKEGRNQVCFGAVSRQHGNVGYEVCTCGST